MGRKRIELVAGTKYGEWEVLKVSERRIRGLILWWCKCSCGVEREVPTADLRRGKSKNCYHCGKKRGYQVRVAKGTQPVLPRHSGGRLTHGQSKVGHVTREYRSYQNAKRRCTDPKNICYPLYGARGIKFKFQSFEQFFVEVGERPEPKRMYSLDRINNNGNYEPGNVRWATSKEQRLNQRPEFLRNFNR